MDAYAAGMPIRCVPQPAPLFYYRNSNWSLYQTQLVAHYLRTGLAGKHLRSERIVEYWNASTDEDAHERYRRTIDNLLWGNPTRSVLGLHRLADR